MLKSYLINLDRDHERLAHMDAEFGRLGIAYERVPAVDGRLLAGVDLAAHPTMTRGEIGNFQTHQHIWDLIAGDELPYGAVFEDDVFLAPALAGFLADWQWIPPDADIVKLETMLTSVNVDKRARTPKDGFSLPRLRSTHWGVAGYIMSARAARALAKQALAPSRPADCVLFEFDEKSPSKLVIYQLDPALCVQHDVIIDSERRGATLRSNIQDERNLIAPGRRPKSLSSRLASELRKPMQLFARRYRDDTVRKKIPYADAERWHGN